MLKLFPGGLGALVQGELPSAEDLLPVVEAAPKKREKGKKRSGGGDGAAEDTGDDSLEYEDAPKVSLWISNPAVEDLSFEEGIELPGLVLNPDIDPSLRPEQPEPHERICGGCGRPFVTEPLVGQRGKVVFTSLFCIPCERGKARWHIRENLGLLFEENLIQIKGSRVHPASSEIEKSPMSLELQNSTSEELSKVPAPEGSVAGSGVVATTESAPSGHAKNGPSSLYCKEICSHWTSLGGTNVVAIEGSDLHERLVTGKTDGLEPEPLHALCLVRDLFKDLIRGLGRKTQVFSELKVDVAGVTWGTSDLIAVNGEKAVVADAKFGWNEVEDAETNLQGWCYAVAVFYRWPQVKEIEIVFAQPRCDMVSRAMFYRDKDYDRMLLRIMTVIDMVENPEGQPYNAVPSNCIYCGNKKNCKFMQQLALKVHRKYSADTFVIPEELHGSNISDPEMMRQALAIADVLDDWAGSVREHALQMELDGVHIPGKKLIEIRGERSIENPVLAYRAVADKIDAEDFIAACAKVSVPRLEELYVDATARSGGRAKKGTVATARQDFADLMLDSGAMTQEGVRYQLRVDKKELAALPEPQGETLPVLLE